MQYGHLNFNCLRTLQQRNMVVALPQIDVTTEVFQNCVVAKKHCESFMIRKAWRAKELLQLIHSDLCDPINPASNSSKRYLDLLLMTIAGRRGFNFCKKKNI